MGYDARVAVSLAFGFVVVGLMVVATTLSWPEGLSDGREILVGSGAVTTVFGFGMITIVGTYHWLTKRGSDPLTRP